MSLHKLTYLKDGLFQLDSETIPVDETTVTQLAKTAGMDDAQALAWLETLKSGGSGELAVEANKGVIVDMYEVEYSAPVDPLKETEQLASHLDEKNDFVGQQLFPGSTTKDVLVGLRMDLLKTTPNQRKPQSPSREAKKVEAFETIDEVPGYTEKSWGGFGKGRVERGDVLEDAGRFFRFIQPISYKQLTVGQAYGDSYSAVNRGYDIIEFLGYGTDDGVKYQSIQEVFAKHGVRSLSALYEKVRSNPRSVDDTYMWLRDHTDNSREGGWYYISDGRWCRGSGAEPLTFWQVEEVSLSPDAQKKWNDMQQRRRRGSQQPTWLQALSNE